VGNQRLLTTNPEDLGELEDDKLVEEVHNIEEEKIEPVEINELKPKTMHLTKTDHGEKNENLRIYQKFNLLYGNSKDLLLKRLALVSSIRKHFLIRPNTNFYAFWVSLLCFFMGYDLIIVPFYICFSPEFSLEILIIDLIRILVYFLDIIIQFHSSFEHK